MIDDRTIRLKARLRQLEDLRAKVTAEINTLTEELVVNTPGRKRATGMRPPCGTDAGYQWHRYHEPEKWPLPADDPCGCRAAHASRRRVRKALSR